MIRLRGRALKQDLEALSAMGIRLSLDDFGTGYSSLGHLKDYQFNEDADVVAEGIETSEHITTLRQLGCTKGQGYYFGRPIPEPNGPRRVTAR